MSQSEVVIPTALYGRVKISCVCVTRFLEQTTCALRSQIAEMVRMRVEMNRSDFHGQQYILLKSNSKRCSQKRVFS